MSEQPKQSNYERPITGTRFNDETVIDFQMARDGLRSQSMVAAEREVAQLYAEAHSERAEQVSRVVFAHELLKDLDRHRQEKIAS